MLQPDVTYESQSNLAHYCRTGELRAIPGVLPGRIEHYRRLILNVVEDMLGNAFPVTREFLGESTWENLCHTFFAGTACQSAQVWQMPGEFIPWMENNQEALLKTHPHLHDLLVFEWTETELFLMEDLPVESSKNGDLLFSPLVLNPEHRLLQFDYPVHLKKAAAITAVDKGPYWLVAHRNSEGDIVFTRLSPGLYYITALLAEKAMTIQQLFFALETATGISLNAEDQEEIIKYLQQASDEQLITGFKNQS